jgi:glycogen debranching enzyme
MIWPFVEGYWAWAASRMKDVEVFGRELDALVKLSQNATTFMEFYFPENGEPGGSPRQLWSGSGFLSMVYHGLFGMDFAEQGISFAPVVPANLDRLTLVNVKYRGSILALEITGHGAKLASFELDSKPATAFFDANLTGPHQIKIRMAAE